MLAVVLALGAAAVFGAATALQHRAASGGGAPVDVRGGHLLGRLLRNPGWLTGICLSLVAFGLHVAALHRGSLALVQPVVVTTAVFAVLIRAALERTRPDRTEVVWGACAWVGLTLVVATVGTRTPRHVPDDRRAELFLVVGVAVAATVAVVARRSRVPARRGFLLGVAAGILYGLTAGLVKVAASHARTGLLPLLEHWSPWLVVPAGLSAFLISQWAFQATRLSVSAPVLNVVDVVVAVCFGAVVFGDHPAGSPAERVVELVGAVMTVVGVWKLVRESERLHELAGAASAPVGRTAEAREGRQTDEPA